MGEKRLGFYKFGLTTVEVCLNYGDGGGYFYLAPDGGHAPRVVVGMDYTQDRWPHVLSILMHEVVELFMTLRGARFNPSPDIARDAAAYVFFADHTKFADVIAHAADGMAGCVPDLARAFNAQFEPKKAKKK